MKYLPEKCDEVRPKFFLRDPKGCTNVLDRFGSWMFFSSQRSLSSGCKVNPEAPLQDRKESRLKRQARFWASGRRLRFSRASPPRSARPTKAVGRHLCGAGAPGWPPRSRLTRIGACSSSTATSRFVRWIFLCQTVRPRWLSVQYIFLSKSNHLRNVWNKRGKRIEKSKH